MNYPEEETGAVKLLLFDIDGTLLSANGQGRAAMEAGLTRLLGRSIHTTGMEFAGRTDREIIRELLVRSGLPHPIPVEQIDRALAHYVESAATNLNPSTIRAMPGVHSLLAVLDRHTDLRLALLTGNIEAMAWKKLETIGLARYFGCGAFGSDEEDRDALVPVAVDRARNRWGLQVEDRDVVVIGDTVRDIQCARANGAFCVAVATGSTPADLLAAADPDVLLADLRDADRFVNLVLDSGASHDPSL